MLPSNIELLKHIIDEISFVLSNTESKSKDQVTQLLSFSIAFSSLLSVRSFTLSSFLVRP